MDSAARNTIIVSVVRHGQTDYNARKIVQGHLDVPLDEEGIAQAKVSSIGHTGYS